MLDVLAGVGIGAAVALGLVRARLKYAEYYELLNKKMGELTYEEKQRLLREVPGLVGLEPRHGGSPRGKQARRLRRGAGGGKTP